MEKIRDKCKKKVQKITKNSKIASKIEKGIYNEYKGINDLEVMTSMYTDKARSLLCNLDPKSYIGNTELLLKVLNKEIKAKSLVKLKPEELFPERWKDDIEKIHKLEDRTYNYRPDEYASDIYKCGKCYQRKTTSYQAQTRCADEGMTTFVQCLVCDNRWRF